MDELEDRFRSLFMRGYPALGRFARHRGLAGADAEDLVAATLEVAWRRLEDVPADDPLPWLYAVAHNLLRNHWRAERRRRDLASRLPLPRPQAAGEPAVMWSGELRSALLSLDASDQEILILVAWDGLSSSEAALVLRCSPEAARARLHRARRRLAARLGSEGGVSQGEPGAQIPRRDPSPLAVEVCDD